MLWGRGCKWFAAPVESCQRHPSLAWCCAHSRMGDQKYPEILECREPERVCGVSGTGRCSNRKGISKNRTGWGKKGLCVSRNFVPHIHGDGEDGTWMELNQVLTADTVVGLLNLGFSFCYMFRGVSCASWRGPICPSRASQDPPAQQHSPWVSLPLSAQGGRDSNYQPRASLTNQFPLRDNSSLVLRDGVTNETFYKCR